MCDLFLCVSIAYIYHDLSLYIYGTDVFHPSCSGHAPLFLSHYCALCSFFLYIRVRYKPCVRIVPLFPLASLSLPLCSWLVALSSLLVFLLILRLFLALSSPSSFSCAGASVLLLSRSLLVASPFFPDAFSRTVSSSRSLS